MNQKDKANTDTSDGFEETNLGNFDINDSDAASIGIGRLPYDEWLEKLMHDNHVYRHQFNGKGGYKTKGYKFLFCNDEDGNMVVVAEILSGKYKRCRVIIYNEKTNTAKISKPRFYDGWQDVHDKIGLVPNEYSIKKPWSEWPSDLLKKYENLLMRTDFQTGLFTYYKKNKEMNLNGLNTIKTVSEDTEKENGNE